MFDTSRYRFILTRSRDLLELKELELATAEFLQLKAGERICTIQSWRKIKQCPKLILVTSRGYARAYEVRRLIEGVEAPVSLHFDEPLPGVPKAMLAADGHLQLVLILDSGRAVRYRESEIPTRGIQTINRREGEVVVGAVVVEDTCDIALITADGFGKRLPVEWIPVPAKPNSRGKIVVARRKVRGVTAGDPETVCWANTSNGLLSFDTDDIPLDLSLTTKSHRFLKLSAGHEIVAVINQ